MDRVIRIKNELVSVSEEVYQTYYKMARRERYLQNDVKVGRIDVDIENEKITYIPNKEDSIERLMEQGIDFEDSKSVENVVCDKAMIDILNEAMSELDFEEQKLIEAIYYKNLTTRQISEQVKVSHVAIVKRHKKILEKIKKYFL